MEMKRLSYLVLAFLVSIFLMPMIVSCDEHGPDGPGVPSEVFEGTIILEQMKGCVGRKIITSEANWFANNNYTWYTVSPLSGSVGETEVSVLANSANEDIMERVGYFTINDERHYVVQRGIVSTSLERDEFLIAPSQTEVLIPISGTFPLDQFEFASDASWAKVESIDVTKEPLLLEDGVTYSSYNESALKVSITEPNSTSETRRANIKIVAGKQEFNVVLVQINSEEGEVDLLKQFYRGSVLYKGTGTWCPNCPLMGVAVEKVEEAEPDRFFVINCHQGSSGTLDWTGTSDILNHYLVSGLPQAFFNGIADIGRSTDVSPYLFALLKEAKENYPSSVAIAAESKVSGDKVKIDIKLASKLSNDYMLTVFFLEDGIEAAQKDAFNIIEDPDHYIHNNILRGTATEGYVDGGDVIELPLGEVVNKSIEVTLPKNVVNVDNVSVLIYVSYPGGPDSQTVSGVLYKEYGYVIDNAVKIPAVDGKVGFRYEE